MFFVMFFVEAVSKALCGLRDPDCYRDLCVPSW